MPAPIDIDPDRPSIDSRVDNEYSGDFFDGVYEKNKLPMILFSSNSSSFYR